MFRLKIVLALCLSGFFQPVIAQGVLILANDLNIAESLKPTKPFDTLYATWTRSAPGTPELKDVVVDASSEKKLIECDHGFFSGQSADVGQIGGVSVYQYSTNQTGKVMRLYEIWYVKSKSENGGSILVSEPIRVLTDLADGPDIKIAQFLEVSTVVDDLAFSYHSPTKQAMVTTLLPRCWE